MRLARFSKRPRAINLALQGGGSHGAFTWGVLDGLVACDGLSVRCVTATSAGALNAVAYASGFQKGGREGARKILQALWDGIVATATPPGSVTARHMATLLGVDRMAGASLSHLSRVLSPYDLNPLNYNPLRGLLENLIDFQGLRRNSPFELIIAATDVVDARARLFRTHEITADVVLASACLPQLFRAIEIDGRAYWDGGFTSNPPLLAALDEGGARDTLLVTLMATAKTPSPTNLEGISAEINRITFAQPLVQEIGRLRECRRHGRLRRRERWWPGVGATHGRGDSHRLHLIDAGVATARLGAQSRLHPEARMIGDLHSAGRQAFERWQARHLADVGIRETADLEFLMGRERCD